MSAYHTLGIPDYSSRDVVTKAYRKLAMKHHPDRGGDANAFKTAKAAFEEIERAGFPPPPKKRPEPPPRNRTQEPKWEPPQSPGGTWRDRVDTPFDFEDFRRANRAAPNNSVFDDLQPNGEPVAHVTLREAFSGFNMVLPRRGRGALLSTDSVNIPPGTPDGYRGRYTTSSGQHEYITTRIDGGKFKIRGFSNQDNIFSAGLNIGDIELDVQLDVIDLITGTWIITQDFLGESLKVRVPSGFNPLHRLKIAGKGYYGWLQEYNRPSTTRQNMYIRVTPVFNQIEDIDPKKIENLYNMMKAAHANHEGT